MRRSTAIVLAASGVAAASYVRIASRRSKVDWQPPAGDVRVGTLSARTLGRQGLPIVLLHGLAASNRYWGAAFDELADLGRLVVPDLLGFGASPKPAHGYQPADHADAVAACVRETTGSDGPALIGAHSTGCLVAFSLARRHPELVAAIVAFAPPLYASREQARAHITNLGLMERLFALDTPAAYWACRWVCEHRRAAAELAVLTRPDLPAPIARDSVQHTWASYSETVRAVLLDGSGIELLNAIQAPVHFVVGLNDPIPDRPLLEQAAATHRHFSLSEWADADHQLTLTHPNRALHELHRALPTS